MMPCGFKSGAATSNQIRICIECSRWSWVIPVKRVLEGIAKAEAIEAGEKCVSMTMTQTTISREGRFAILRGGLGTRRTLIVIAHNPRDEQR